MVWRIMRARAANGVAQNGVKRPPARESIPFPILLSVTMAEDERRWDNDLRKLLSSRSAVVRKRAALATGRIGNEGSVNALTSLLQQDADARVRAMAAFALGEMESADRP